jgi:hypothetical protein
MAAAAVRLASSTSALAPSMAAAAAASTSALIAAFDYVTSVSCVLPDAT